MKKALKKQWKFKGKLQEVPEKLHNYMGADETVYQHLDHNLTTEFVGYDNLVHNSKL